MTRIRHIPDFYKKLHAIELVDEPDGTPGAPPFGRMTKATMPDVSDDDPRLLELRWLLGVRSTKTSKERKMARERIDFDKLRNAIEVRGLKRHEVASMLSTATSTIDYKLRYGTFTDTELEILERKLKLEQGALIKHG